VQIHLLQLVAHSVGTEGEIRAASGVVLRHFGRGRRISPRAEGRTGRATTLSALVLGGVLGAQFRRLVEVSFVSALRLAAVQRDLQTVRKCLVAAGNDHFELVRVEVVGVQRPGLGHVHHPRRRGDCQPFRTVVHPESASSDGFESALGLRHALENGRVAGDKEVGGRGVDCTLEALPPSALGRFGRLDTGG